MVYLLVTVAVCLCFGLGAALYGLSQRAAARNWQSLAQEKERLCGLEHKSAEAMHDVAEKRWIELGRLQVAYSQLEEEHRATVAELEGERSRANKDLAVLRDALRQSEKKLETLRAALREAEEKHEDALNMLRAANEVALERAETIRKFGEQMKRENALKGPVEPSQMDVLRMDLQNLFAYNGSEKGQRDLTDEC